MVNGGWALDRWSTGAEGCPCGRPLCGVAGGQLRCPINTWPSSIVIHHRLYLGPGSITGRFKVAGSTSPEGDHWLPSLVTRPAIPVKLAIERRAGVSRALFDCWPDGTFPPASRPVSSRFPTVPCPTGPSRSSRHRCPSAAATAAGDGGAVADGAAPARVDGVRLVVSGRPFLLASSLLPPFSHHQIRILDFTVLIR